LALTHHDPLRTDAELTQIVDDIRSRTAGSEHSLEIFGAAEGQELELCQTDAADREEAVHDNRSATAPAVVRGSILMCVADPAAARTIREAAESDDILLLEAGSAEDALRGLEALRPSLMVIERQSDDTDSVERYLEAAPHGFANVPLLVVADREELVPKSDAVPIAYLIKPFSAAYVRTCIRAAMLRRATRWQRMLSTQDEEQRLSCLRALDILDTPPESRFDEITRLAATSFGAPMALVSLVDKERQWFKSSHGLEVKETSRETSFCSHAVSARDVLIVPDTFYDPRFADNPLVTQGPRIRFYAGCPIFVGAHCVGTVCVLDHRPRQLVDKAIDHLKFLARLVERELCKIQEGEGHG
jgi:AmiR/NasT family two-component response regulator